MCYPNTPNSQARLLLVGAKRGPSNHKLAGGYGGVNCFGIGPGSGERGELHRYLRDKAIEYWTDGFVCVRHLLLEPKRLAVSRFPS